MRRLLHWVDARFPLFSTWQNYASNYYVPKNLNFLYCFGVLALVVLVNQFLSGIWLTMFYTPTIEKAFASIQNIMRDIPLGWLLRYLHTTGASAFFIVMYIHLLRGLLYGSYQKPRELVWLLGMALLLLLMAEAFFGYLLPWGQLSYWGAQVITSLGSAIPYVGDKLVLWLRGDFTVSQATLQRFFALHIVAVPLLVIVCVWLHIVALHAVGSNNPQGIDITHVVDKHGHPLDGRRFHPYFTVKDLFATCLFLLVFFAVVFFWPSFGGAFIEPLNSMPANPLITPDHIKPMWYLAPFYAMLRAIPDKLAGVLVMVSALVIWLFLPWLDKSSVRALRYKGRWSYYTFLGLCCSCLALGYLGMVDVTGGRIFIARICIVLYFAYFIFMPWYTRYERCRPVPERIPN